MNPRSKPVTLSLLFFSTAGRRLANPNPTSCGISPARDIGGAATPAALDKNRNARQIPGMNFERYAGMVSAIGIVLILMIVTWLDLWGPINVAELQKWQTLMTGFMALVAAGIAYWGATEKVRHDREVVKAENGRRKLALFLKIEFAFRQLSQKAHEKDAVITFPPIDVDQEISSKQLFVDEPPELEEAWTYLDLFPRELIAEIRNVRNCIRSLAALSQEVGDNPVVWPANQDDPPSLIKEAQLQMYTLWQSAGLVADVLAPLIDELAPEMDQNARMSRIYGEPMGD
jgi:hypothetical protein